MNVHWTRVVYCLVIVAVAVGGLLFNKSIQPTIAQTSPPNIDEEIVYLDADGVIRILDSTVAAHGEITWYSEEDGFIDFTLGDFNADGDLEIAAIRNQALEGEIIVYDPVMSSVSANPDGWINDIPWKKLATIDAPGNLLLIEAGEFDDGVQGDELLYVYESDPLNSALTVLKGSKPAPSGTTWLKHINKVDFGWIWHEAAIGNVDNAGTDEVVLISNQTDDDELSRLHIYRIDDGGLADNLPFATRDGIDFSWQDAAIGEVKNAGFQEIVAVRESDSASFPNTLIYQYFVSRADEGLRFDAGDEISLESNPSIVFLGDVNGIFNSVSDNEIGLLRSTPNDDTSAPRFFTLNKGDDEPRGNLGISLDSDWQAGNAGDVDGDGKAEFVLMRDDTIRILMQPDQGEDFVDFDNEISTDREHIRVGNLDANGILEPVSVSITTTGLENGLPADETGVVTIQLESPFPIDYTLEGSLPSWITSIEAETGTTPAEIRAIVDTTGLQTGEYTKSFTLTSSNPFARFEEESLQLALTVLEQTFAVDTGVYTPGRITAVGYPCADASRQEVTAEIEINGSTRTSYSAVIVGSFPVSAARAESSATLFNANLFNANGGALRGGFNASGDLELSNAAGESMVLNTADLMTTSLQAAETNVAPIRWPSGVEWVSAESKFGSTDDTITLTFDTGLVAQSAQSLADAWLVIVADEDTVEAPFNVRYIPMTFLCARTQINLPVIDIDAE